MNQVSCNCIVCAQEFEPGGLQNVALSKINFTAFKVCESCLNSSDPVDDYKEVRNIVSSYLNFAQAKHLFAEVQSILDSREGEKE